MPDVKCEVTNCMFNRNERCEASSIQIVSNVRSMSWSDVDMEDATMIPQSSAQTNCDTFIPG
ncbi:MAG: DUF1540 domain-containing protein [Syntrophomonadaceae bacterium]|nr:DUF1540 domain-containing protein [Syntrophomonadaceae bacterium]